VYVAWNLRQESWKTWDFQLLKVVMCGQPYSLPQPFVKLVSATDLLVIIKHWVSGGGRVSTVNRREVKQVTFLTTRTPTVSWAVIDWKWWRQPFSFEIKNGSQWSFTCVISNENSCPIHNGSIYFWAAFVNQNLTCLRSLIVKVQSHPKIKSRKSQLFLSTSFVRDAYIFLE
jgi:hypothetical protein